MGFGFLVMVPLTVLDFADRMPARAKPRWLREQEKVHPPGDGSDEVHTRALTWRSRGRDGLARQRKKLGTGVRATAKALLVLEDRASLTAMHRPGILDGRLLVTADALAFGSSSWEQRTSGRSLVRTWSSPRLVGVRRVPRGQRVDGTRDPHWRNRMLPRVRVELADGSAVALEVLRPRRVLRLAATPGRRQEYEKSVNRGHGGRVVC